MALLPTKDEKQIQDRIARGRERADQFRPGVEESWEFYRGNHYAYVDENNMLQVMPTVTTARGGGKPRHRARQKRNLIFDHVLRTVSLATQRTPSYQVPPTGDDPRVIGAAKLSEKIALWGHGRWAIRNATVGAVTHAVVGGEAFAWPFFDNSIGPFIDDAEGNTVGMGDVRVPIFGATDVYWEPGLQFELSPWHVVEQAFTPDKVEELDGYLLKPGKLTPDAKVRGNIKGQGEVKLVLVTNYLERPCAEYPEGRWVTMANKKRIVEDKPYPGDGEAPCLHKLSYAPDPDRDRDLALVPQLLDAQRTHNDAGNKAVELKNHHLIPRLVVPPGMMKRQRWTDDPGKVLEIPNPKENVVFAPLPDPSVLSSLFEMADRAEADMGRIAAQNDIPSQVTSGQAIQSILDNDQSRLAIFITNLAEWYGNVMADCLGLVQEHYSEPRLIQFRGDFGWESIDDFRGAKLRDQTDVTVLPDSIEPRTKQAQEQKIMNFANLGWIPPEQAMTAIEQGTADVLTRGIANDEARAGRIINRIKDGTVFDMPDLPTGRAPGEMSPGWMPRYSDNLNVWQTTFEDWMKTEEWERLDPPAQEASATIYAGILQLQAEKAQQEAMAQTAQAEAMGMQNASKPQGEKPTPSLPSLNGGGDQNQA